MNLADTARGLVVTAAQQLRGTPAADELSVVLARIDGPLRVAIAGRVKAGKSTLLNALVRDRLAATDAGECTRVITEYRKSASYEVRGLLPDGTWVELPATRSDGLRIELPEHLQGVVQRIEICWPSSTLDRLTLVDTPGLASINAENSALTESALTPGAGEQADADAVLYLMRHVHQRDVAFLESFMDRTVMLGTPLNAIGLLSRADEIGAGRLDAMTSAARIAGRYRSDPQMRQLVSDVLPIAALLAETASTADDEEIALLRRVAAELGSERERERELATVDRVRSSGLLSLSEGERERLLAHFGLFGLRTSIEQLALQPAFPTGRLLEMLHSASGIGEVRRRLESQFLPHATVLKARTALTALRRVGHQLLVHDRALGDRLLAEVEKVEAAALDFSRVRVLHLMTSGLTTVDAAESERIRDLVTEPTKVDRGAALAGIDRWRAHMESPLLTAPAAELGQLLVRLYEDRATH